VVAGSVEIPLKRPSESKISQPFSVHYGKKRCRQCERDRANVANAKKREAHKIRTHCVNGHELVDPNIYWLNGRKYCHICKLVSSRKYEENRKQLPQIPDPRQATHCPKGHLMDRENTFMSHGIGYCRICNDRVPPKPKEVLEAKPALFACGHPRTPENSYDCQRPNRLMPSYQCITCRKLRAPIQYAKQKIKWFEQSGEAEKLEAARKELAGLIGIDSPPLSPA